MLGTMALANGQDGNVEMQLSTGARKPKSVITQTAKPKTLEEQKRLEFEGFLVGLTTTNKLTKVLDFTSPVDPVKEQERMVVDRESKGSKEGGRTIGFRLISIRF